MKKNDGFIMVFKKCKCGVYVGCMLGDGIKDGDIINHDNCKLIKNKLGGEK